MITNFGKPPKIKQRQNRNHQPCAFLIPWDNIVHGQLKPFPQLRLFPKYHTGFAHITLSDDNHPDYWNTIFSKKMSFSPNYYSTELTASKLSNTKNYVRKHLLWPECDRLKISINACKNYSNAKNTKKKNTPLPVSKVIIY